MKAYRREYIENIKLYGEMHRFIPIYAAWEGAKVTEIEVNHYAREFGESNYGLERIFKVVLDLVVVKFMQKFSKKPIYFFGGIGIFFLAAGILFSTYALFLKLFLDRSFISTPLPILIAICFMAFLMSIMLGIIQEMNMRTYYETQNKLIYTIKTQINF